EEQNILRADAIILVYSIADTKSFTEVTKYYRSIMFPIVLVGTKADIDKKQRRVSSFEGQQLARSFNCPFIEVSAKTNDRVHEAFVELMRLVDKQYARFRRFKKSLSPILL
ncbi:unnamed protein product, partial [Enterobius vermicularis]|uniref:small monomeric GTPase n=1 Tax=Enterobius vermicularis TaxID=51028 RepID=A0A0N4VDA4_ENTVE